jgi:peptidyl-prolyl cis-trans isomerase B (cyclophilin B)
VNLESGPPNGDADVLHYKKSVEFLVIWVIFLLALALPGCKPSGQGDSSPQTSINGPNKTPPTTGENPVPAAPKQPLPPPMVLIETSKGNIRVQLDSDKVPITVDNFLRYVKLGHYDQTIVHQVFKGRVFLAGGYDNKMTEKRARTPTPNEANRGTKNLRGTIAMARLPDDPNSATSQFFINVGDNPSLDYRDRTPEGYGYCAFGKVVEGMEVVEAIGNVDIHDIPGFDCTPKETIVIQSIRLIQ